MAVNNLSNKQQMIKDYMIEMLRASFPTLDLGENSAFMETFGLTHLKLLEPLLDFADRMSLMQSLDNANFLTEEEMDEVASKEYFARKPGNRAVGEVTFVFRDVPSTNQLQIPSGLIALSRQGYRYFSTSSIFIDELQLANFYDPDTFQFKVTVPFIAEYAGSEYNISANDMKSIDTVVPYLEYVYNDAPFTGGTNRETNAELALRIQEGYKSPNLGTEKGYIRFIKENFAYITEVLVAGYGHPLMQRDIIGNFPADQFNQTVRNVHWGSKIDIYVRGINLTAITVTTNAGLLPFEIGDMGVRLYNVPVYDIQYVTLVNPDPNVNQAQLQITNYALVTNGDVETDRTKLEIAYLRIDDARVVAGTPVQITYRYDTTPLDVTNLLYNEDYRPPTADVRIKQATPKYLVGNLVAKSATNIRLMDSDRAIGRQNAYQYVRSLTMGAELQFSDLYDAVLHGDPANEVFDYLKMPSQFLLLSRNNNLIYDCLSDLQRAKLEQIASVNSYMYDVMMNYRSQINTYEYLDVCHLLSTDANFENALNDLRAQSTSGELLADALRHAKDLYIRGNANAMLMPATVSVSQNEYFDVSQLNFYEYKAYSTPEWHTLFQLLNNYAQSGADDRSVMDVTVYVLSILYVLTQLPTISSNVSAFYRYMQNISKGTPIQDRFYI